MKNQITIRGYIGKKLYDDEKTYNTGYKVYSFYPNNECKHLVEVNGYGTITISGKMPVLIEEKEYVVVCELDMKSKYPSSYKLITISYDRSHKITRKETINFLGKINIGSNVIESIMEHYPNIIELVINDKVNEIDVSKIKGIGKKKLKNIIDKVNDNYRFFDIMTEYADMGLTMKMVQALYDKYTNVEMIKKHMSENPYECLCSIARVGFKTADVKILEKNSALKTSPFRMRECVKHLLKENENAGNTWISVSDLHSKAMEITPECITHFINILKNDEEIYLNVETKRVAFKKTYYCEYEIAVMLFRLLQEKKSYDFDVSKYNKSREGLPLTLKQQSILPLLKTNSVSVLMGFAGTGKSTSTKAVVDMIIDNNKSVRLIAPTGRASKVLREMTNHEASTIHRGIRLGQKDDKECPFEVEEDFVICDEASMIDIFLMRKLLRAINPKRTSLLFVCDPEQLASVGCGNVISDIIKSGVVPTVFLDEVFRYGEGGLSYIATETRNGKKYLDVLDERNVIHFGNNKDYSFFKSSKEDTLKMVETIYTKLINSGMNKSEVVILTAYNKGDLGTYNINNIIQSIVNPKILEDTFTRTVDNIEIAFRVGDKVIQTSNNYKAVLYTADRDSIELDSKGNPIRDYTEVFNGDDGIVKIITEDYMVVDFYGELIEYEKKDLSSLLLGYAISVHKSQGSTFDNAIVVTPISHKFFTKRNLLYVAVTRARNKVIHIGDIGTINYALKQSETIMRNTFLYDLLKDNKK